MKLCDVTQFYSPMSGGVKRYISEKQKFVASRPGYEHVLIIPGAENGVEQHGPFRIHTVRSPRIDDTSRYRVIYNVLRVKKIIHDEHPDIVESGDPYHVAWAVLEEAEDLGIPATCFYHSHFPDAYLRTVNKYCGSTAFEFIYRYAQRYIEKLYNRFDRTLVPSPHLAELLTTWGVKNTTSVRLGVDTRIFHPAPRNEAYREALGVKPDQILLLSIGRLAWEKNTLTLLDAFKLLHQESPGRYHLHIIGEGPLRKEVMECRAETEAVSWHTYFQDSQELAQAYHAADLFVHPGVLETFGLVTVEAQACGVPVVGIRGSYMDRLVFAGLDSWAHKNTPASLAEAIDRFAHLPLRDLGQSASVTAAAEYSWDRVLTDLFDHYQELCNARTTTRHRVPIIGK